MPDYANLAKAVRKRKSKKFPKADRVTARQAIGEDDARAYRKRKVKANKMTADMKARMKREKAAKAGTLNKRIREQQADKPY